VQGAFYGAVMALIILVILRLAGAPLARGRALMFNFLVLALYWVAYLVLRGAGVDDFWAVGAALAMMVAVELGIRRFRPSAFAA
jgi:hypothetical protein